MFSSSVNASPQIELTSQENVIVKRPERQELPGRLQSPGVELVKSETLGLSALQIHDIMEFDPSLVNSNVKRVPLSSDLQNATTKNSEIQGLRSTT